MLAATVEEFLNMELGIGLILIGYAFVGAWAYKQNKQDHASLGAKVDKNTDELKELIKALSAKIDEVRQAITDHETIWHSPIGGKPPKKQRAARKK